MVELTPPFFAIEGHDVAVFDSLDDMASAIEAYDVDDNQFFDARGRPLAATVDGYRVSGFGPVPDVADDPEELERLLRRYFGRLPDRDRSYSEAAAEARSLDELVRLCLDYERRSRPGLLGRRRRRSDQPGSAS